MMKKKLYKKILLTLTAISACLLIAAGPLPDCADSEEPVVKMEEEIPETESEEETEPWIAPLSDKDTHGTVEK